MKNQVMFKNGGLSMKFQRWEAAVLAIALLVGLLTIESAEDCQAAQQSSQNDQRVVFQWAFGALKDREDDAHFIPITRDTVLDSGDQIKFFLKTIENCRVYLIYLSAQGELSMLFPGRVESTGDNNAGSGSHYIPEGDNWFCLDESQGKEKFYLLASATPLNTLESLVDAYKQADRAARTELTAKILAEIRKLRKQHLKLKTHAERPVSIVGNMRGNGHGKNNELVDIAQFAVEISADRFFSRTFTIDHR
jgi:hypothetical protein